MPLSRTADHLLMRTRSRRCSMVEGPKPRMMMVLRIRHRQPRVAQRRRTTVARTRIPVHPRRQLQVQVPWPHL